MATREAWVSKWDELGLLLQRRLWRPLRNMMDIFHVLPLAAVVVLFVLLATDGQFREIYIAYLEGADNVTTAWAISLVAALAAVALISAVLYEAHYALSTMRINIVYSSYSNPEANSRLRSLQGAAAFVLAFLPWLGLTLGLFGARNFVANRYCQLLNVAKVKEADLAPMQHLPLANGVTIAAALIVLGLAIAYFASVGRQNRIAQRAVACFAPLLAVLLFLLFTDTLNFGLSNLRLAVVCSVILGGTAGYFLIYQWLYRRRSGFIYVRPELRTGVSLRKRRRRTLAVWAFLPWFFLALYFASVQYVVPAASPLDNWRDCPVASAAVPVPGHWAAFAVAMCCTMAIGLLTGHLLGAFSASKWRRRVIVALVAGLALALVALSWSASVTTAVSLYRFIGPLGTVGLQLLFLISTFALLAAISQRSGFPALTLVILALVVSVMFPNYVGWAAFALGIVCLAFAGMALLSGRLATAGLMLLLPVLVVVNWIEFRGAPVVIQNPAADASLSVKARFACWLAQRGITAAGASQAEGTCSPAGKSAATALARWDAAKKYPVFVIAAEGGGIYAASAISTFLSRLEEVSPHFDEHVFAISGVSGGSIGAAIFQAFDHATHPDVPMTVEALANPAVACPQYSPTNRPEVSQTLAQKVANVMQDDHFSPVVGSIFPEIFGAPLTRSDALVASFEYSAAAQDVAAGRELCAPFAQHWAMAGAAPALVLNSTWVETGFRTAFAPFHLHDIDESLYSFSDPEMPDEDCPSIPNKQNCVSLMAAAAVSARFPLILPPFSTDLQGGKRWNFVDGAYSDNSGATTALDLYKALEDMAPQNVDLRIILITSSNPQPDLTGNDISGTVFRDTIAPLDALMKVRSNLGNEAVARACSYIYQEDVKNRGDASAPKPVKKTNGRGKQTNESCIDHAGQNQDAALQIVEIQDQTYGLALGWKISRTSFAVVSWMLGKPENCSGQPAQTSNVAPTEVTDAAASDQNQNAQLTDQILQRNSCVMKLVADLVGGSAAPAAGSKPAR